MQTIHPYRYKCTEKSQAIQPGGGCSEPARLTLAALLPVCWPFLGGLVCLYLGTEKRHTEALTASERFKEIRPPSKGHEKPPGKLFPGAIISMF